MPAHPDNTIAALASAAGPGARGIVRISGPAARDALDGLFEPDNSERWRSSRLAIRHTGWFRTRTPGDGSRLTGGGDWRRSHGRSHPSPLTPHVPLPVAVYLWPTPRSFTGQPAAEIHTAGSPPLLEAVLTALYARGVRPARPGEFTLRAFLAGRIDLLQAEAVLGVIDAHEHRELELALRQLAGGLSGRIAAVRNDLLNLLADLEAGLDFVDEDIEFVGRMEVIDRLTAAGETIASLLQQATARMQSTGRRRVVLAGLPNAGKSTLFNALAGREAALVSDVQGTTRDYLTAELDWNGTAVELVDTAGWDAGTAGLMPQAQALRGGQLEQADLVLFCTPADADEADRAAESLFSAELRDRRGRVLTIVTKCDLIERAQAGSGVRAETCPTIAVSARTRAGLNELVAAAVSRLAETHRGGRQLLGMTAARSRESLEAARSALDRARDAAAMGAGDELVSLEVRSALDDLGRVVGTIYTDDLLDRIFSRFCVGK
ncbi:MAG TPA: GTPase [Planctomycetaceae bacterium]|nr:GTPase [Planctomycetaceae bacterium]